jgi:hypothetical protein
MIFSFLFDIVFYFLFTPVDVVTLAVRTGLWSTFPKGQFPGVVATITTKFSHGSHFKLTPFNL